MSTSKARGVQELGKMLLASGRGRGGPGMSPEEVDLLNRGATIYQELCFSCHADDGRGAPMAGAGEGAMMAPSLAGSPRVVGHRDYVVKVILHGLTGPLDGKTYSNVMVPMGTQKDDWIAAIASYIRNDFGNSGSFVTTADVARVRALTPNRRTSWTQPEIERTLPSILEAQPTWVVATSHNPSAARNALNTIGWSSLAPQAAGMYFQIELPEPTLLTEIQFTSPGGGGARGAGPTGAPTQRMYQVQLSTDGKTWSPPVAQGAIWQTTAAAFAASRAKFVRVTQTVALPNSGNWVVQNVRLLAPAR
jgi:mono/diheme cytochrome c family protein